ncbi:MAG: radical SAM protein [Anaerolineales bacterium]|nr:radical SAM protein [Anaerolineales bacterium]
MQFDKILLVNPPNPPGYVSNKDSMGGFGQLYPPGATFMPPVDLVYLAGHLEAKGIPVQVMECLGERLDQGKAVEKAGQLLDESRGSALLVVRTSGPTLDSDVAFCAEVKARQPLVKIAIYGAIVPHVVKRLERETCLDYLLLGEPDLPALELVTNQPEDSISGLHFRTEAGWVANPDRPFIKILDEVPFPKWELFPYHEYKIPRSSLRSHVRFLPMLTSRGCPVGCHYCPYPVGQGALFRLRTPQNVVDEIEHLIKDLGIEYILFRDPIFSLNQNRVLQICAEIKRRGLQFEWKCETRVDCLREETLRAMAEVGCIGINFGVESAEVEIQANSGRKPITREQFLKTIRLCQELGIRTYGFFIVGLPGDTVDTILSTIQFSIELRADWVQFTTASPLIGTKLREWAIEHGQATEDEYAYINCYDGDMGNENLTRKQVAQLGRFAQFIGGFLINRKGILKEPHPGFWYRPLKAVVDAIFLNMARLFFHVGKLRFTRRFQPVLHAAS